MDALGGVVRSLGMAAGLLLSSGVVMTPAMAALITYNFTGDVIGVDSQLASQFNISQTMSGSMTVNSTNINPHPNVGTHIAQDFKAMIGTYTVTAMGPFAGGIGLGVGTGQFSDSFTLASSDAVNGNMVNSLIPRQFEMFLVGPPNTLSSDALPNPAPSVASFTARNQFFLTFFRPGSEEYSVNGVVTSLTAVPLPAAALLFGGGLVALAGLGAGGFRRRCVSQA